MNYKMANYRRWRHYDFGLKKRQLTHKLLVAQTGDSNTAFQLVGIKIM
jgi:hypothetical protein